jgi:hypothetical protein
VNPHVGRVPRHTGDLVFAKPIVDPVVKQNTPAMGVDVNAMVVRPEFAWAKAGVFGRVHYESKFQIHR